DIATASDSSNNIGVSVLQGRGDGTFTSAATFAAGAYPGALTTGDFNGDGWLDAATGDSIGSLSVLVNDQSRPAQDAPTVSIDNVTVTEGNTGTTGATFTLSLSAAYTRDVTVHYQTVDGTATAGSDYAAASGDVTIPAGQTTRTVTIAVLGDR